MFRAGRCLFIAPPLAGGFVMLASLTWAADKPVSALQPMPKPAMVFARNCQGCHGSMGSQGRDIPTLAGRIGYFTRSPEGRAYLVQIPNVALSATRDDELAEMLNWMLTQFSAGQLPIDFRPYTAEEVSALRKIRITPASRRIEIVKQLEDKGLVPHPKALMLDGQGVY